jgi:hypoxanthine phosphoribosyltransferase
MQSYNYKVHKGKNEITWNEFHEMCKKLAGRISQKNIDVVIGIARGGLYPAVLIAGMLRKEFFPIRITRRKNDQVKWKKPIWKVDVPDAVKNANVLIIDEIADSGETLSIVSKRTNKKLAKNIKTAALITHSWANPKPDYFCLESDALIIFPWDTQILIKGKWKLHPELEKPFK